MKLRYSIWTRFCSISRISCRKFFWGYASGGYWNFTKNEDIKIVESKFVFRGLQTHYQHQKWATVLARKIWRRMKMDIYKLIKNSNWKACLLALNFYLWVIFLNIWDIFQKCWWFSFSPTFCSWDTIIITLREMCSSSELFLSVFSGIWTEYGEILRSLYSVRMRENTDQNNAKYGHFLHNVKVYEILSFLQRFTEGKRYKKECSWPYMNKL